jgi:hypothetical protein
MKTKDITVGETYGLACTVPGLKSYGPSTPSFPEVKTTTKVKVTEMLGKGWAMGEESYVTWDRDMLDDDKKPIAKTKTYKVWTRSLKVI